MKQTLQFTKFCLCTFLSVLLFSCSSAVIESGTDTATIELTIPALVSGETETSASRAVLGYTGMTVSVTVDGSGFDSFTKTFSAILNTYVVVLTVPKGTGRTFTIQAADTAGTVYAEGSTTADITDAATSLSVTLAPVVDNITDIYTQYDDTQGTTSGIVSVIPITIEEAGMTLSVSTNNVTFAFSEADGTVLSPTEKSANAGGDDIYYSYTYTIETEGKIYLLYTPTDSTGYSIDVSNS
ncbi:MAG: hypothetical protein LKF96_05280 [Treponema sp.]|jgi:hypothetical protein|nr:hypothetical protein [Treponema sp.]